MNSSYMELKMQTKLSMLALCLLCISVQAAQLKPSAVFDNHMVVQRNSDNKIWGYAERGSRVKVEFRGNSETATADETTGKWLLKIAGGNAGGPFDMKITSKRETLTFSDVLVGDVWLCSGQSNMAWPLKGAVGKAGDMENRIRLFMVGDRGQVFDEKKAEDNDQVVVEKQWMPCSPETAVGFSIVGFHFGKNLSDALDIPIGLISCDVGGSRIEAWMSREELRRQQQSAADLKTFLDCAAKNKYPRWISRYQSCLYSTMLRPIIGYGIKGTIWYQGESNLHNGDRYNDLFNRMITEWRSKWGIGEFPVYYVQIAPFNYTKPNQQGGASLVRQAQREGLREYRNVGMAVTADIGNWNNIHPGNKEQVGYRLARWALAKTYGNGDLVYSGPLYKDVKVEGGKAVVSFEHGDGLKVKGDALKGLYLAGDDQRFYPATATVANNQLIVRSSNVSRPKAVRYGWSTNGMDYPLNLYNAEDLPASPFRTDDWPVAVSGKQNPPDYAGK